MSGDFEDRKLNIDFTDYWLIIRKRLLLIVLLFFLVLILSVLFTLKQKPVYQTGCKIEISSRQPMATIEGAMVTWYGAKGNELQNEIKLISNKTEILEKVLDILHKREKSQYLKQNLDEKGREIGNDYFDAEQINYIERLFGHFSIKDEVYLKKLNNTSLLTDALNIEPMPQSNIVEIMVKGPQPNVAIAISNILAMVYRTDFWKSQTNEAEQTMLFIKKQLDDAISELENGKVDLEKITEEKTTLGSAEVYQAELTKLRIELDKLRETYQEIHPKIVKKKNLIDSLEKQLAKIPQKKQEYDDRIANWQSIQASRKILGEQYIAAKINYEAKKVKAIDEIQIIAHATKAKKLSPNEPMNIIAGGILGIILGCLIAFVWEGLDTSIGKIEDVERITKLPVIAHIPLIGQKSSRFTFFQPLKVFWKLFANIITFIFPFLKREAPLYFDDKLIFNLDSLSVESEAYRTLRTNIHFAIGARHEKGNVIAITSTSPREGKTLTATNLAIEIAQMGKMALLVEGDMRRPQIASMFKIDTEPGLSDLLLGTADRSSAVRTFTDILMGNSEWDKFMETQGMDNLHILPCGTIPPNPTELLLSKEFSDNIQEFKNDYDFIIIDTPPSLPVSDSSIIGTVSDGTVLIYQSDKTSRHLLLRAIQMLKKNQAKLLGIVINQLSFDVILKSSQTKYSYSTKSK